MAFALYVTAQDDDHTVTDPGGRTYLFPNAFSPAAPSTFSVGTSPNFGYALDVHGEQMNPPLDDVFKTNADKQKDSYWRMFHDQNEVGQLFHWVNEKQFNMNAPLGHPAMSMK